jgi:signal transduction histidine kinase
VARSDAAVRNRRAREHGASGHLQTNGVMTTASIPDPTSGPAPAAGAGGPVFDAARYGVLVESVAEGVIVFDPTGTIVLINEQAQTLLGLGADAEVVGHLADEPGTTALTIDGDPIAVEDLPVPCTLRTGEPGDMVLGVDTGSGRCSWISVRSAPLEGGGVVATVRDATHLKLARDLDRAVLDLATTAVEVPVGQLTEVLEHTLGIMGRVTAADRVVYVTIDRSEGRAVVTHDWSAEGEHVPRLGGVPLDLIPTLLGLLTRRETIVSSRAELEPGRDYAHGILEIWQVEAAVTVPVMDGGQLAGFVVFGWRLPQEVPPEVHRFATIAGQLLGSLHVRSRVDRELRELNASLDDRVRARSHELALAQERMQALVDALPDLMFELDPDGIFVNVHAPSGSVLESPPEAFLGRHVQEMVEPDMAAAVEAAMDRIRSSLAFEVIEYHVTTDAGAALTLECRLVPRQDGGILAIIRDVSGPAERYRMQREQAAQLAAANRELEMAVEAKDDFLASVSHELRTPLAAMLGLTEILLDEPGSLTDRQRTSLETVQVSGHHLLGLINDLLDIDGLRKGQTVLERSEVLLSEVAREAVDLVRPLADIRGVHLELVLAPPLTRAPDPGAPVEDASDAPSAAPGAAGLTVRADRRRVRQILLSLLDNAVKFTNPGGSAGVQVWAPNPDEVTIAVWDTGLGIAEEDRERIFEPFTQVPSGLAQRQDGSGLGLALVGHLVALHGGRVELESAPGRGSRFAVTLPVTGAATATGAATGAGGGPVSGPAGGADPTGNAPADAQVEV